MRKFQDTFQIRIIYQCLFNLQECAVVVQYRIIPLCLKSAVLLFCLYKMVTSQLDLFEVLPQMLFSITKKKKNSTTVINTNEIPKLSVKLSTRWKQCRH